MFYTPHKLYLATNNPTQKDADGNPIPDTGGSSETFLCECFLHDAGTKIKEGYAGQGISVSYYVNMERRHDLEKEHEVAVYEEDGTLRGKGRIVDIRSTSGMQFGGMENCTTIFLGVRDYAIGR